MIHFDTLKINLYLLIYLFKACIGFGGTIDNSKYPGTDAKRNAKIDRFDASSKSCKKTTSIGFGGFSFVSLVFCSGLAWPTSMSALSSRLSLNPDITA